jgi:hypothetical protein
MAGGGLIGFGRREQRNDRHQIKGHARPGIFFSHTTSFRLKNGFDRRDVPRKNWKRTPHKTRTGLAGQ